MKENTFDFGFCLLLINLYPFGNICIKIDSSNAMVDFSNGGNDDIIFGFNCSLYFWFKVSTSSEYNHFSLYIIGS